MFASQLLMRLEDIIKFRYQAIYLQQYDAGSMQKTSYNDILANMNIEMSGSGETVFDLRQVLQCKDAALKLSMAASECLVKRSSVMERLLDGGKLCTVDFIEIHTSIIKKENAICKKFEEFTSLKGCSTYMISLYNTFLILVTQKFDRSSSNFREYKRRIMAQFTIFNNIKNLSSSAVDVNSIILNLNLEKGKEGTILNSTVDYNSYLGDGPGSSLIGSNINNLFPDMFRDIHRHQLKKGFSLHLLDRDMKFVINGLDGYLREIDFIIKINTDYHKGASLLAMIRPVQKNNTHVVILDMEFQILAAQKGFWDVIDLVNHGSDRLNFKNVSVEGCISILLKKIAQEHREHKASSGSAGKKEMTRLQLVQEAFE